MIDMLCPPLFIQIRNFTRSMISVDKEKQQAVFDGSKDLKQLSFNEFKLSRLILIRLDLLSCSPKDASKPYIHIETTVCSDRKEKIFWKKRV